MFIERENAENKPIILTLDLNKISNRIKFFEDPELDNSVYVTEKIPANSIVKEWTLG